MKILIIGGSGFLGSKLVEILDKYCQSTYYKNPIFPNQINLDLTDKSSIKKCLTETRPEIILHCGGLTKTDVCETNIDLATKVNCLGTEILLNEFDGKFIYFSTDYVFDGKNAPYNENSQPNPINEYGKTKLFAERKVLEQNENLVIRVSGLYGINKYNNRFLNELKNKELLQASTELISTPTYISDVIESIPKLMQMSGIVHFTGEQPFSRYEFLKKVVESLGLNTQIIKQEYNTNRIAKRPKNSSLISIYKLKKTPIEEALKDMSRKI